MKQNLTVASQKCEISLSKDTVDGVHQSGREDPFIQQSERVSSKLDTQIHQTEEKLSSMREKSLLWNSVEKMMSELRAWLDVKRQRCNELQQKPAKLHVETADMDITRIQVKRGEERGGEERGGEGRRGEMKYRYNALVIIDVNSW